MHTEPVHTETHHGHTIKIFADDDPQNPRTDYDNLGTMVCWHRNYTLGDDQPREDAQDWLEGQLELSEEQAEKLYSHATAHIDDRQIYATLRQKHDAYFEALLERFQKQAIVMPLFLYDHSGITMNTSGFHCPWDSGQVGFIVVRLEDVRREYAAQRVSKKLRRQVETVLKGEVETYDHYLRGNVYGFVIEDQDGETDSCWGFLGDYDDYCLSEARACVPAAEQTNQQQGG